MGGLLSWEEVEVSWLGPQALAVQPLQVAHSVLFPTATWCVISLETTASHLAVASLSPLKSLQQSLGHRERHLLCINNVKVRDGAP